MFNYDEMAQRVVVAGVATLLALAAIAIMACA